MNTQAEHFDVVANEYEETIPAHVMAHLTARRVAIAEELVPEGSVLDVGCGTGVWLEAMPARYAKDGVDVSAGMLERARHRGLEVHQASADALPFQDARFDLAASFAVLHHLIDPDVVRAAIREMCRVVRPGGAVLIWDHNPLNPAWPLIMRRLPQDAGDERLVGARLIRRELIAAGMQDIRLRRLTFVPPAASRGLLTRLGRVEPTLERVPGLRLLAAHNVFSGRRR